MKSYYPCSHFAVVFTRESPYFLENDSYFVENAVGQTTTVNRERFRAMLNDFLLSQPDELVLENMCFKQDVVTEHSERPTTEILRAAFPDSLTFRFGNMHCLC